MAKDRERLMQAISDDCQYQADAERIITLETENASLRARLEISHAYNMDGGKVPFPEGMPDGIECRDETIRGQDEQVEKLRAALASEAQARREAEGECERLRTTISDPNAVHINMLARTIAKPSVEAIIHVYGHKALNAALRETDGVPPAPSRSEA